MFTDNWKESRVLPTKYLKQEEPSKEFGNFQCDRFYVFFLERTTRVSKYLILLNSLSLLELLKCCSHAKNWIIKLPQFNQIKNEFL